MDSTQELSPAELQTAVEALPQAPQTVNVRLAAIEKTVADLVIAVNAIGSHFNIKL